MAEVKRSQIEERSLARMLDGLERQEAEFEHFRCTRSLVPPGRD